MNILLTRFGSKVVTALFAVLVVVLGSAWLGASSGIAMALNGHKEYTTDFRLADCNWSSRGANPYFILRPGYRLVYEGQERDDTLQLVITVLSETRRISVPGLGTVETRVVQEKESVNGNVVEISRNYFAICKPRNDVIYFGEDVDIFHEDGSVTHDGAWIAGQPDGDGLANPGLIMPGTFLLGSKYFQEIADGIALDNAVHTEMGLNVNTPAGNFSGCVKIEEGSEIDHRARSTKLYCPGVGLVIDDVMTLVGH